MEIGSPPYVAYIHDNGTFARFVGWHHLTSWQQGVAARTVENTTHEPYVGLFHYSFDGMRLRYILIHGQLMEATPLLPQVPALAVN